MEKVPVDWLRYVWIIPIVVGFVTFILTSMFTLYREKKSSNIFKRALISYNEYELTYPFENVKSFGEGLLLLNADGKKLINSVGTNKAVFPFLVLKNITDNDLLNVKIESNYEVGKGKIVEVEFFMPLWDSKDVIYIPMSHYETGSKFVTNIDLTVSYTTIAFEKFKMGYKRIKKSTYEDFFMKKYFNLFYLNNVKYHQGKFYTYEKITKPKDKNEMKIELHTKKDTE